MANGRPTEEGRLNGQCYIGTNLVAMTSRKKWQDVKSCGVGGGISSICRPLCFSGGVRCGEVADHRVSLQEYGVVKEQRRNGNGTRGNTCGDRMVYSGNKVGWRGGLGCQQEEGRGTGRTGRDQRHLVTECDTVG